MRTWMAACCALVLLAGCGPEGPAKEGTGSTSTSTATELRGPADWPSAEERRLDPNHVPTPYSVDQLRLACGPESKRVYRTETKEGVVEHVLYTYRDLTSKGCVAEQTPCNAEGQTTGEPRAALATWLDLQRYMSFPAEITTLSEEDIKVPAGSYGCMHYVVSRRSQRGTGLDKYWFAWDLPGPPVRLERYVTDKLEFTLTLVKVEGVRTK